MKKYLFVILFVSLMLNAGCSAKSVNNKNSDASSNEKNVVLSIDTEADRIELAHSFEELCNKSDFIAEVKITESSAYFADDGSDRVFTEMIPEIIEIYKGEYNGEKLGTCGGFMEYNEFVKQRNVSEENLTEEECEPGYVYYNWLDNKIPEEGDTIIFFGTYSEETNQFMNTYSNQGIYFCEGENVMIYSLECYDDGSWKEPLLVDLEEKFTSEEVQRSSVSDGDISLNKSEFVAALK